MIRDRFTANPLYGDVMPASQTATVEVRAARADEMDQFGSIAAYAYAGAFGDGPDNIVAQNNRPEWTLCAFVDGRMAASYSTLPLTMRANGRAIALGGVSAVGTLPEYRRRGLLRKITEQSFVDMRARGQTVAALWASQAAIYQRYGYALASAQVGYRIDSIDVGFNDGDGGSARLNRVHGDAGYEIVKQIYIDFVAQRSGYLHRAKALWLNNALAPSALNGVAHIAVAYDGAAPVGYVIYHARDGRTGHPTRPQEIIVRDLVWLTSDAYRSLWSWLARHDLVGRIVWARAPVDDPAPELFVEPRLLNADTRDGIWLRVIDARAALEARGYQSDASITLEIVADDLAPWNRGRFKLECAPDGARVTATGAAADLRLPVKSLASLYSGFRSARALRNWGLLDGDDAAVERATRIFATRHAPHCPDTF
jgi:predicted acetyltransferase